MSDRGPPDGDREEIDTDVDGLLDAKDAYRLLRATEAERDAMIERYGIVGTVERDIAAELADPRPLADPAAFPGAFRAALRSIEVLDRNGARTPSIPRLGPLTPVVKVVVGFIARLVVRNHQGRLVRNISRLVSRREAVAEPGSEAHHVLRFARLQATRVEQTYGPTSLGVPAFLVGGAFITAATSVLEGILITAIGSRFAGAVVAATSCGVLLVMAWCALRAAGVARRRIRMSTDQAMSDLWTAMGSCGRPPRDQSFTFAIAAIGLSVVSALAVPLLVYLVVQ